MTSLVMPNWKGHRLIASHFPPINLFETLYDDEEDLKIAFEIESLTNDRLTQEMAGFPLIRNGDRLFGGGTTPIMAAFCYIGFGSRFTDGKFGVYYCAENVETAIAETIHHKTNDFLAATQEDDTELTMREYVTDIVEPLVDVTENADLHDADSYDVSQAFGRQAFDDKQWGILYNSVRKDGNQCAAILRPPALANCKQAGHYRYIWSGKEQKMKGYFKLNEKTFVNLD